MRKEHDAHEWGLVGDQWVEDQVEETYEQLTNFEHVDVPVVTYNNGKYTHEYIEMDWLKVYLLACDDITEDLGF